MCIFTYFIMLLPKKSTKICIYANKWVYTYII